MHEKHGVVSGEGEDPREKEHVKIGTEDVGQVPPEFTAPKHGQQKTGEDLLSRMTDAVKDRK